MTPSISKRSSNALDFAPRAASDLALLGTTLYSSIWPDGTDRRACALRIALAGCLAGLRTLRLNPQWVSCQDLREGVGMAQGTRPAGHRQWHLGLPISSRKSLTPLALLLRAASDARMFTVRTANDDCGWPKGISEVESARRYGVSSRPSPGACGRPLGSPRLAQPNTSTPPFGWTASTLLESKSMAARSFPRCSSPRYAARPTLMKATPGDRHRTSLSWPVRAPGETATEGGVNAASLTTRRGLR